MSEPGWSDDAIGAVLTLRDELLGSASTEQVSLDRLAGRVLAEPVTADGDVPPHSRATMDGVAVDTGDDPPLRLVGGRLTPGDDAPAHEPGTTRRVATGAPLPAGADAMIPRENARIESGSLESVPAEPGDHVITRASVLAAGETVLEAGRRLAPRDAVALRDLGYDEVPVRSRLSTAVLATGTEIHEGLEPDRDSGMLANLVRAWGGAPALAGSVPDDPAEVGEHIATLASDHDVVVTTGGTGVGRTDETADVLGESADVRVREAPLRPGSNTTVAWLADAGTAVVSLPGPPGAAFASATLLLRPLLVGPDRLSSLTGTMSCDLAVPDGGLTFVVPVEWADGAAGEADGAVRKDGDAPVVPFGHPASTVELYGDRFRPHRVATCVRLSAADGFVLTGEALQAGERVAVVPYTVVES